MAVGLVLVSHVERLGEGVRTLAGQMAPDVVIAVAGGTDDGEVGTSFDKVQAALAEADGGDGVVLLYDLGSAQMTAELALDMLDDEQRARVRLVDAPLVEGAIAAAVMAQQGDLEQVVEAAAGAGGGPSQLGAGAGAESPTITESGAGTTTAGEDRVTATAVLPNPLGLHARPAAEIARLATGLDATITVGRPGTPGVNAASVLTVVAQGLKGGDEVEVSAGGADARRAVDAVLELVKAGFGEPAEAPARPEAPAAGEAAGVGPSGPGTEGVLPGVVASTGVAVGPLRRLRRGEPVFPVREDREAVDAQTERQRLAEAIDQVDGDLRTRASSTGGDSGTSADVAGIAEAHRAMLADPALREQAEAGIVAGRTAERAWWEAIGAGRDVLAAGGGPAAERAADVEDIGRAVLAALGVEAGRELQPDGGRPAEGPAGARAAGARAAGGEGRADAGGADRAGGAIVVAEDLVPSDVTELAAAGAAGFALARGGRTSHAAIIARGLGLPLIVGLGAAVLDVPGGSEVVLDAEAGVLRTQAGQEIRTAARRRRDAIAAEQERRLAAAQKSVVLGGRRILVSANIGSLAEARAAVAAGADGVGLLRTELLYVERPRLPGEEEQAAELAEILGVLGDRPVTIRTLDVGGDKLLPALGLDPWRHGPLGERGLRYGLRHPDLLRIQLRAILRAAHAHAGGVLVMAPMVTYAEEAAEFGRLVDEAEESLAADGIAYARPAGVGVMLEVPAAALQAEALCEPLDFVSVGSNDLTQYVMAADRTNDAVGDLYRADHPALWRLLGLIVEGARAAGCEVAVCGELAADPGAAVRLAELGVHELSMAAPSVPAVKAALLQAS